MTIQNENQITSPIKAIRAKCLDCCCWSYKEVDLCPATQCPLHPFRFGKNPYRKEMGEEQKEKARVRMTEYQAKKKEEN